MGLDLDRKAAEQGADLGRLAGWSEDVYRGDAARGEDPFDGAAQHRPTGQLVAQALPRAQRGCFQVGGDGGDEFHGRGVSRVVWMASSNRATAPSRISSSRPQPSNSEARKA